MNIAISGLRFIVPPILVTQEPTKVVTRTSCRKHRRELDISGGVKTVSSTNTLVAARDENTNATHTELCDKLHIMLSHIPAGIALVEMLSVGAMAPGQAKSRQ